MRSARLSGDAFAFHTREPAIVSIVENEEGELTAWERKRLAKGVAKSAARNAGCARRFAIARNSLPFRRTCRP